MSGQRNESVDVLLVEDDRDDVRHIKDAFDRLDTAVSVHVATDGDEALTRLTDRREGAASIPELVLLDLDLPETDGLEVLEVLADDPALARLPVLVLAQSATVDDVHRSYELAANAYLTKPTDPAAYAEIVEAVADFWLRRVALPTNDSRQ